MHKALPRSQLSFGGRGRAGLRRSRKRRLFMILLSLSREERETLRSFCRRRQSAQDPLERCRSERRRVAPTGSQSRGKQSGMFQGQLTVGQRQRLLWQNAFFPLVALRDRGGVE